MKNKKAERFEFGLAIVLLAMSLSLLSFLTEESSITGFAAYETENTDEASLAEFQNANSLSILSAGNYYIDEKGIVYWIDEGRIAMAKISNVGEIEKNRHIYIDKEGKIGYVLESVSINENEQNI
ncbi:hypothetical protein HYV80_06580 [Candidatus Woesearchaeota archaeon]|nr:hypothetical protein [Candidatus Woesearchaeota archaeon]